MPSFTCFLWLFWRTPSTLKITKSSPPQVFSREVTIRFQVGHLKIQQPHAKTVHFVACLRNKSRFVSSYSEVVFRLFYY